MNPFSEAIDVHAHFGIHELKENDRIDRWLSGDAKVVSDRAQRAEVRWSIVSALTALNPFRGNIQKGNEESVKAVEQNENLLFWTVVDPLRPESDEVIKKHLQHPKCMGIKMHPFMHQYDSRTQARPVFELAAQYDAVILTHSGDKGSYPEDFISLANDFPEVRLIVAHLGHGDDGLRSRQVRAIEAAKHRNIWTDTSSSMSMLSGVIEWAIGEIGDDRILFGTDTPLYYTACQKTRIVDAEIPEESKKRILYENAHKLLGAKLKLLDKSSK